MNSAVTHDLVMALLIEGESVWTVPSMFRYEPCDPFAVHLAMTDGGAVVEWTFARELLAEGLRGPAGLGDVQLYPCLTGDEVEMVRMKFGTPEGEALVEVPAGELAQFLDATYRSVPQGTESDRLDVETALASVLADC